MADETIHELEIPDGARDAKEAVEVLRAFIGDGALHVIFDPETFRHDVTEWGRLLSDIAHHIAKAVALDGQMESNEALIQVRDAFNRGVGDSPVATTGKIKGRVKH
ncbi:MAG: DUF5076 domain-containing protein [Hyphomicrobium sp.]|nr:DUF5076 domain-containing protein [Hyphomicrobium sp.]